MKLIKPTPLFAVEFLEALDETIETDAKNLQMMAKGSTPDEIKADFPAFTEKLISMARGENLPNGYVPGTILWLVDGDKFIGQVSIRQQLTEKLKKIGGHIGYFIRPSERQKGFGTLALKLAILEAQKLGIKKILVTCDLDNTASRKIIEKNGGVFQDISHDNKKNAPKMRFWITPE